MSRPYWPIDLRRLSGPKTYKDKRKESKELAEQIKAFRAKGGKITKIPEGKSGEKPVVLTRLNKNIRLD